jgi:3-hydroxybutyryl-CoA dehydratase
MVRKGTVLPTIEVSPVSVASIDAYARLSGDDNPIHLDEAAAVGAGFAGRVVHGALLAAIVEAAAADWFTGRPVLDISMRFIAPMIAGGAGTVSGRVTDAGSDRVLVRATLADSGGAPLAVALIGFAP